jgi:hypothetical protein
MVSQLWVTHSSDPYGNSCRAHEGRVGIGHCESSSRCRVWIPSPALHTPHQCGILYLAG